MIHLIIGENSYIRERELAALAQRYALRPEIYDGVNLSAPQLADCIAGGTLFDERRLVVIKELSVNKQLWDTLSEWTDRVSETTALVLIEGRPDKRTKTYKKLAAAAKVIVADYLDERHRGDALVWTKAQAKELGVRLTDEQVGMIVSRSLLPGERPGVAVIDQQCIATALASLSVLEVVTDADISTVLPESVTENVFELLETALRGDNEQTKAILKKLQASADGYMVVGVLMNQWCQLAALKLSGESVDVVAAVTGLSPYGLRKLSTYSRTLTEQRFKGATTILADLDVRMKTTGVDPWAVVDRFIGEVCKK